MDPVLIAGGGIAGLSLALTLHQIGVPARIYEAAAEMKPLGVGINLQPNAVRELFDLGIGAEVLDRVGLPAREWALVGLNGNDIHAEPRGLEAGYNWPQYAVHRGAFHMMLYEAVRERLGPECRGAGRARDGICAGRGWRDAAPCPCATARPRRRAARC
jgi:2-polyprenyl-6-methoxyphenol hydroxylase-like FAD-dependent oxidoreductase